MDGLVLSARLAPGAMGTFYLWASLALLSRVSLSPFIISDICALKK